MKISRKITILMPTYNCGKYISQSMRSILNQTYKEFEFLIIDDGSTDNTEDIVKTFNDDRIIYEKIEHKGTSAALNYGISIASGNWIARIDADDLNTPDRLEKQINFLNCNLEYDVISSCSVYFNDKGKVCYLWKPPVKHQDIYRMLDLHNPLNQSGIIFKKDLVFNEKYDESFMYFEDYELMYRVRDKAKFYNIPEYLVYTRIREDSKSVTGNSNKIFNKLFPVSAEKLIQSRTSKEKKYWNEICGDLCLFYGYVKDANKYFLKSLKFKNYFKMIMIVILSGNVRKLLRKNIKLRLKYLFQNKNEFKKFFKNDIY